MARISKPSSTSNRVSQPSKNRRSAKTSLTEDDIARLREQAERTGIGAMQLLRGAKDKPKGLSASIIGLWLRGITQTVDPEHLDYAFKRWAALPSNRRVALTPQMRADLRTEFARTGTGPVQILKWKRDVPDGLTRQMVQAWSSDGPKPNTVGEAYWQFVMSRLRSMPDGATRKSGSRQALRELQIEIDDATLDELRRNRERTGIGGALLLRNVKDRPDGLTPAMISGWLSGKVQKADAEHVAYVLTRYRAWS